ncbi:MAG TPA: TPM domain-containing protein [Verrucomicrobiae bacterium]
MALLSFAKAAEVIPPVPTRYFNDYAGVVSKPVVEELNSKLEAFEKETSSQVVVAIYPKMQSDSSVQDYTVRVAQAWRVGQKEKRNGAVLFLFIQDRQMFLQVGYGLEGAIPDATAKQITEFEIKPRLQARDYDGGLRAGVNAIMAAARGEYKGTGRTVAQSQRRSPGGFPVMFWIFAFFLILIIFSRRRRKGGRVYGGRGWSGWDGGGWGGTWGGSGGGWSGGSSGGGWSGGGDSGGSFSSGGGDFGGGGAGSSW